MYISVPQEEVTEYPPRQHCVDESKIKKVFDQIKASSEVLEQLVVHQVSHHARILNFKLTVPSAVILQIITMVCMTKTMPLSRD
jgi:hypothetical protein